ncbi:MAG: Xaa-Pro aminopeptidase, partial [Candidatus Woesearchaeota archaeon]
MNYKKRHDTLVKNIPQKSMFVCTRTDERMKGDGPYFDFTSGDFLYFTGITQPNSILLITTYPKKQTILFIDKPNKKHELWMGAQLTKQQAKKTSQVHVVKYLDEFKETYAAILKTHTLLTYSTHPRNEEKNSTLTSALRVKKKKKNMYTVLMDMRVIKDTQELALIKKAIRITADGFANVSKENLKTESQIMGIFAQSFFSQNATFAYQPICASGKNACVLHYITNDSVIDQQKPILLDVGAEVCGYDADITRTINITTKRQEAIYTAVLAVQEFAISLLKPG